ncbi:MAG: putative zinc-binding metallopeptidase [Planctomycetota bacterium]
MAGRRRASKKRPWWAGLPLDDLLDIRICDLEISLEGTALEHRIETLFEDFERRGLRFRPHVWLSSEWFSPDAIMGFAIPFFLAHPRLARLERSQMLQVEGGGHLECLRLMRHESGHAIDNAYRLRRRKRFRELFGKASEPYHDSYAPKTTSRRFVRHLDLWYAQSHPLEDFAETFAVWLTPRSAWRRRYDGWPVLEKLEYVDELMTEIADVAPPVRSRARPSRVSTLKQTLREHYEEKKSHYESETTGVYDRQLRRLFSETRGRSAARFWREQAREIRDQVARVTSHHPYTVKQVIDALEVRSRELGLRCGRVSRSKIADAAVLVTMLTVRIDSGGRSEFMR